MVFRCSHQPGDVAEPVASSQCLVHGGQKLKMMTTNYSVSMTHRGLCVPGGDDLLCRYAHQPCGLPHSVHDRQVHVQM